MRYRAGGKPDTARMAVLVGHLWAIGWSDSPWMVTTTPGSFTSPCSVETVPWIVPVSPAVPWAQAGEAVSD